MLYDVTMKYVLKPTASNLRTKTCEEDSLEQMCADCNTEVGYGFPIFLLLIELEST